MSVRVSERVCVCALEQVLEIEFCVASAFVVVAVLLLLVLFAQRRASLACCWFISLLSLLGVFGKGARDFVNFELCFLWICLFAGSRSCGSWSSQQHPSREARIETATATVTGRSAVGSGFGIGLR